MQRWRVPLGFLCAGPLIIFARPNAPSLAAGGAVALAGLAVRAWASGHIRKNDRLAVSGPYAYTRNPLYLGSLIMAVGFMIAAAPTPLRFVALSVLPLALFFGIYIPVMRVEASTLAKLFGEEYARYAAAVSLLLPRLTPYKADEGAQTRFDAGLYMRYREYRAALGLLLAWCVLMLKAVLAF